MARPDSCLEVQVNGSTAAAALPSQASEMPGPGPDAQAVGENAAQPRRGPNSQLRRAELPQRGTRAGQ
jgi:hypothetical protein